MTNADRRLKVLVVTEDDPLYVVRFFEVFFAEVPRDRIDLVGVTISRAFHEPLLKTARRIHRFYGTVDFLRLLPRYLAAKFLGTKIGTLAAKYGVPIVPAESVNSEEYLARVRALAPDVVVSVAAPEIFRAPLLGIPRYGCINIHSGRLPKYRGMMPTFWQLKNGEPHVTVTIHEMVEKLDAGGIVRTLEFPLERNDSLHRVITGTKQAGARLMIEVLSSIDGAKPPTTPLDMRESSYFKFPQPADVAEFRRRGHRML
jgi:methionyl-tRNA formyltransferase